MADIQNYTEKHTTEMLDHATHPDEKIGHQNPELAELTKLSTRLENPLAGKSPKQLVADAEKFCVTHGLDQHGQYLFCLSLAMVYSHHLQIPCNSCIDRETVRFVVSG